jgi:hypothetical protein
VLASAALIAIGCGGGSSGNDKADLIAKAEQICKRSADQLNLTISQKFGPGTTKKQLVQFTKTVALPNIEGQLQQIRALPQPDTERATLQRYYSEYEQGIAELKRNPGLVVGTAIPPAFKRADKLARAYGIGRCVR